jgi:hypothetical protein
VERVHAGDAGDFDWPGLAIANRLIDEAGATPWRMSATGARTRRRDAPPAGAPVEPTWDPEPSPAMRTNETAVHEEAALPDPAQLPHRTPHPTCANGTFAP